MSKRLLMTLAFVASTVSSPAIADKYNFYFAHTAEDSNSDGMPDTNAMNVKIINTSTYTVYDGDLTAYYGLSYTDLVSQGNSATSGAAYVANLDYIGSTKEVLDFVDTTLTIRENSVLQLSDGNSIGDTYTFDRVTKVDVSDGSVAEQILIAESQAAYDLATDAGFTAMLAESAISRSGGDFATLTSFSTNITNSSTATANVESDGGLNAEKIVGGDGATLFRQETDGTVHIGENSIVLSDESVSASGNDEVYSSSGVLQLGNSNSHRTIINGALEVDNSYSSSGVLQLGNNNSHRTVIKGALEVDNPTKPNHAANKKYVDGIGAMAMASLSAANAIPINEGIGIGTGYIGGQSAFAFGLKKSVGNGKYNVSFTASHNTTSSQSGASAAFGWSW